MSSNNHIFMACCVCSSYLPTRSFGSTHADCKYIRHSEKSCIVQDIYLGNIGAYRSHQPVLPEDYVKNAVTISKTESGFVAESVMNPNLTILIDQLIRAEISFKLDFEPTTEELTPVKSHIYL